DLRADGQHGLPRPLPVLHRRNERNAAVNVKTHSGMAAWAVEIDSRRRACLEIDLERRRHARAQEQRREPQQCVPPVAPDREPDQHHGADRERDGRIADIGQRVHDGVDHGGLEMLRGRPAQFARALGDERPVAQRGIGLETEKARALALDQIDQLQERMRLAREIFLELFGQRRDIVVALVARADGFRRAERDAMLIRDADLVQRGRQRLLGKAALAREGQGADIDHHIDPVGVELAQHVVERAALIADGEQRHQITPDLRSAAISASPRPSISRRIASVCWPMVGGGNLYSTGVAEYLIGLASSAIGSGAPGCAMRTTMSRAFTCGSANTWSRLLIGLHGTPACSSAAIQSADLRCATRRATSGTTTTRLTTRALLVVKRGSAARSGTPAHAQNFRNCPSLPIASTIWPSALGNTWYGTTVACALPRRGGAVPEVR